MLYGKHKIKYYKKKKKIQKKWRSKKNEKNII